MYLLCARPPPWNANKWTITRQHNDDTLTWWQLLESSVRDQPEIASWRASTAARVLDRFCNWILMISGLCWFMHGRRSVVAINYRVRYNKQEKKVQFDRETHLFYSCALNARGVLSMTRSTFSFFFMFLFNFFPVQRRRHIWAFMLRFYAHYFLLLSRWQSPNDIINFHIFHNAANVDACHAFFSCVICRCIAKKSVKFRR